MKDKPFYSEVEIEAALAACDSEPVHIPGAIQPFGVLICFDRELTCVEQLSSNIENFLGISVREGLAASPRALLGRAAYRRLRDELANGHRLPCVLVASRKREGKIRRFHVTAFRTGDSVVVELEPVVQVAHSRSLSLVNEHLKKLVNTHTETDVLTELVATVRVITGHDRTLIYRFDEHWNGRVVVESRNERLPSLLNHHFPATDIPPRYALSTTSTRYVLSQMPTRTQYRWCRPRKHLWT
ncbi:phytochrome family protein [Kineobactrum salinum]|uniref:Phytochrome chromophore attachment site domain-containing protein n=1 Tax=Kineobactrum salinum TaxID=2708301 RepID=A0A6C0U095_9GAMM|nr:hypothetical protein [Kineobactrum salinum]QIB65451.1 hypothetical protein G3T16_08590 [Kineobactrum salinum]